MEVKDYYSILNIPSNANASMIKKAYRKLALQTHPDKQPTNPNAIAEFQLIQEAYTVLSTPSLKEAYLSQRWYFKSQNYKFHEAQHTPEAILQHLIKLSETYRFKNIYQIDYDLLSHQLKNVISNPAFPDLNHPLQEVYKAAFVKTFYSLLELLPYKKSSHFITQLLDLLPQNSEESVLLSKLLQEKKHEALWAGYKYLLVIIIVTILIFWMLFSR